MSVNNSHCFISQVSDDSRGINENRETETFEM